MAKNGTTVTIAVIKRDIDYLKEKIEHIHENVEALPKAMAEDRVRVARLAGSVSSLKWIFGTALAILALALGVVASLR